MPERLDHRSENAKTKDGLLLQIAALESEIAQTQAVLLKQQEEHQEVGRYTANCPKGDRNVTRNDGCHPDAKYGLQVTRTLLRSC